MFFIIFLSKKIKESSDLYLAPIVSVEKVVGATLVSRGLFQSRHARGLRDPHLLLHMISPFPVVSVKII